MQALTIIATALLVFTSCVPATRKISNGIDIGPAALSASHSTALPGQQTDGSVLLPNLWSLRPVGRQIALGDFPVNIAMHPGGKFAAILHSGQSNHEIVVVDVAGSEIISRASINESFYGLAFSSDGEQLFCS